MSAATRVVGQSLPRMDAPGKATGTATYAADFALPGMLHGAILRSTEPHSRLVRVDTSRAAKVPGVRAIIAAGDVPDVRYGGAVKDETVFARDKVRYVGQPLAAVAATTLAAATAALAEIQVVYEPLTPVFDLDAALATGATLIHEDWAEYAALPILKRNGNVCNRARIVVGDVERGFEEADRIFEHRFETAVVHQGYTEPRAAVAQWDSNGQVTVWSNTQLPFEIQATLSEILAGPAVEDPGDRARHRRRFRRQAQSRRRARRRAPGPPERTPREGADHVRGGADRGVSAPGRARRARRRESTHDGRITGEGGQDLVRHGRVRRLGPGRGVRRHARCWPDRIAFRTCSSRGCAVYTNKTNCGSFRAPSGPQANFAVESQMDIIADALGDRPARASASRTSCARARKARPARCSPASGSRSACSGAAKPSDWTNRRPGPWRGKGLACGWWTTTGGSSGVYVKINPDGTVALNTGAAEIGTAALTGRRPGARRGARPRPRRHQRRVGGHALDAVRLRRPGQPHRVRRRQRVPGAAVRSQEAALHAGGGAARRRGERARASRQARRRRRGARRRWPSWRASRSCAGGGLIAHGTFVAAAHAPTTPSASRRHVYPAFHSPSFHAHAVDLSVDPDTGEVTIHHYVVAQDVGLAMNPAAIEGQIEGGVAQGLGQALSEEIVYDRRARAEPEPDRLQDAHGARPPAHRRRSSSSIRASSGRTAPRASASRPTSSRPPPSPTRSPCATGVRITSLPITAEKIALAIAGDAAP